MSVLFLPFWPAAHLRACACASAWPLPGFFSRRCFILSFYSPFELDLLDKTRSRSIKRDIRCSAGRICYCTHG